jgi:hypothetical protein
VVDDAVNAGAVIAIHPGVYALHASAKDRRIRLVAAVVYTDGLISHIDALDIWELLPPPPYFGLASDAPVHISLCDPAHPTRCPGLVVHRRSDTVMSACARRRQGLPVTSLERAVIDSWPLLPAAEQRVPVITALRQRRTTAKRLDTELDRTPHQACAGVIRSIVCLVAAGCQSELELLGHHRVFTDPRLPTARAQVRVRLRNGAVVYLDRYFEAEMVAVELDGAAFHGSSQQRERDVRRDTALAALGIVTVRLTHQRLVSDPEGVIQELLTVLWVRRTQLGTGMRLVG